jgi:hypothetical protein
MILNGERIYDLLQKERVRIAKEWNNASEAQPRNPDRDRPAGDPRPVRGSGR